METSREMLTWTYMLILAKLISSTVVLVYEHYLYNVLNMLQVTVDSKTFLYVDVSALYEK